MNKIFTKSEKGGIGCSLTYEESTASTNTMATEAIGNKALDGSVFVADFQEKGRGQRGNFWESESGKNLTFSALVYPTFLNVFDHFYLSKVVANAMVDTLQEYGITATIKWPNDIYVGDKKIAGVLIENGLMGATYSHSIWGIGLNVNQTEFISNAPNPTSMQLLLNKELDRNDVLQKLMSSLNSWYEQLKGGNLKLVDNFYFNSLYRRTGMYEFLADNKIFTASIDSIEHTGELVLKTENGTLRSFAFKEVAFVI